MATLTKRVAEAKAALQAEREKAYKSTQALKAATALVSRKDEELERTVQVRIEVETELEVARAALATAEAKISEVVTTALAEAVEEEFGAGFF